MFQSILQSKWILRGLVILLFALSGTALVLGIILFKQRETLKGRTQKLEMAAKQVAATLEKTQYCRALGQRATQASNWVKFGVLGITALVAQGVSTKWSANVAMKASRLAAVTWS